MYKEMCKKDDFLKLLAKSIEEKPNIGMLAAEGHWSSIGNVPKLIGDQIGQIMDLVQYCINNYTDARKICDKTTQGVIVTEFQPVGMGLGYELYLQIVPKDKVKEKHTDFGEHLPGITVYPDSDNQTLLLINASQWMLYEAKRTKETIELTEDDEVPMTYGTLKINFAKVYTDKVQKTQADLLAAAIVHQVSEKREMKSLVSEKTASSGNAKSSPLLETYRTLPKSPLSISRGLSVNANLPVSTSPAPSPGGSYEV